MTRSKVKSTDGRVMFDADVAAYLNQYFETGKNIFKEYSYHHMRLFYMERGAGASNLHMRFNLSYVKPGNVLLSKKVTGSSDIDRENMKFPYQIWYKDEDQGNIHLLESDDENINVTYQYSSELVDYAEEYTPPNSPYSYRSVYFINPGRSAEIHFPANTIEYKVIECGVNTEVYDTVRVNGAEVEGESIGNTKRRLFDSGWLKVSERPTVVFENHVDSASIRTLSIWKQLYDGEGNLIPAGQDDTRFTYRIYLSNGSDDVLKPANMHKYHVRNPEGNLCRWDADSQQFISLGKPELAMLTEAERKAATFETSMNGAISMIPAGYDVGVPGLPVGTRFRVVERDSEMPLGYQLIGYQRQEGTYLLDDCDENTGWVRANESPTMYVRNRRGFEIRVNKIWSDAPFVDSHDPVYTAVYVDGRLLEGSVRQIAHPATSVRYFFGSLQEGKTLDDYVIREVAVTGPTVGADGVVSNYRSVTPVEEDSHIAIQSVNKQTGKASENEYFVEYPPGTAQSTSPDIPAPGNTRIDTVENTRSEGVSIRLLDMKTSQPLAGGQFTLSHEEDGSLGTFSTDSSGTVTVLYDVRHDEKYTLTQTGTPDTYVGLPAPVVFSIVSDEDDHDVTISGVGENRAKGRGMPHKKTRGAKQTVKAPVIASIDVFNKPYILCARNVSKRTGDPLAGAQYALYRSVKSVGGETKDFNPMPGYGNIVPGSDGVIDGIENTLPPGRYYLTEINPAAHYERIGGDVIFTVGENGQVTLESDSADCEISRSDSDVENAYYLNVRNDYIPEFAALTVTKTVGGSLGNQEQDFTFTISVAGADASESYQWSKNGEAQTTPLRSGGSFTLRHGESVTIDLPETIPVTLTEQNENYTTSFRLGDSEAVAANSRTFSIDGDVTLEVVNTLEPAPSGGEDTPPPPGTVPGTGEGLRWIMLSLALMLLAALGCVTVWFTALLKGRSA